MTKMLKATFNTFVVEDLGLGGTFHTSIKVLFSGGRIGYKSQAYFFPEKKTDKGTRKLNF